MKTDYIEACVQMKLYKLTKRHFVLLYSSFLCVFLAIVAFELAGPHIALDQEILSHIDASLERYHLRSPYLSLFNQQLTLYCKFHLNLRESERFSKPVELSLYITDFEGKQLNTHGNNYSRMLSCAGDHCNDMIIAHWAYIATQRYSVNVLFSGFHDLYNQISNVSFVFRTINPEFTQIEIWARFSFLILSFIVTCFFSSSIKRFSFKYWSIEQRWMAIILPSLILYNDPLFPVKYVISSWWPLIADCLFQTLFYALIMMFLLSAFHGMRLKERLLCCFYFPKFLIVGALWLLVFGFSTYTTVQLSRDPAYYAILDFPFYTEWRIALAVLCIIFILYGLFLATRAYSELRVIPYFDTRLGFLFCFTSFTFICFLAALLFRCEIFQLQPLKFSEDFSFSFSNSSDFMSFYGLFNFYIYVLAYVYLPAKNAVQDSYFRENAPFSALDDSEEDIVYGTSERTFLTHHINGRKVQEVFSSDDDKIA